MSMFCSLLFVLLCVWCPLSLATITTYTDSSACLAPNALVHDVTRNVLYASCGRRNGIIRISLSTDAIDTMIPYESCDIATNLILKPNGDLFVTCTDEGILSMTPNGTVTTVCDQHVCFGVASITYDIKLEILYASINNRDQFNSVIAIDGYGNITRIINESTCISPGSLVLNTQTTHLYMGCGGTTMFKIDVQSHQATAILNDSYVCDPHSMAGMDQVYVTCWQKGVLLFHDMDVHSTITTITSEATCRGASGPICISSDNIHMYLACSDQNFKSDSPAGIILDVNQRTNQMISITTAQQCPMPSQVIIDDKSGTLYATCSGYLDAASQHVSAIVKITQ